MIVIALVIKIIKAADTKQEAIDGLVSSFELDEIQANAILDMRLSKLTSLEVNKLNEELTELEHTIADLNDILDRPERVLAIIRENLEEIKNTYGTPSKTQISIDMGDIENEDLIPREEVVISMTNLGYIKRLPLSEYKAQNRGGVGVTAHKTKEEDFVSRIFTTNSHDDLLFFTTKGKVYTIRAYEVPVAQKTAKGRSIVNLIQVDADEKVTAVIPRKQDADGNLIMATKDGLIKKTKLSEFDSIRKTGKIAITLEEGDELIEAVLTSGNDDLLLASDSGKCIRFNEKDVRVTGRSSQGVKSMEMKEGSKIIDMTVVHEGKEIITITENGYGKKSKTTEFRTQLRGGSGVKAGEFNEKTGKLVALKQTDNDKDVMVIADNGVIIRTPVSEISTFSRVSQGVRVMRLKGEAKIVSAMIVDKEEEQEVTEESESEE